RARAASKASGRLKSSIRSKAGASAMSAAASILRPAASGMAVPLRLMPATTCKPSDSPARRHRARPMRPLAPWIRRRRGDADMPARYRNRPVAGKPLHCPAPVDTCPRMPRAQHAPIRLPLAVLALLALVLQLGGWLDRLDNRLGDLQLRHHAASRVPPADIVLVAIDQKSLEDLNEVAGAWPWPRAIHGELLDGLQRWQPRVVGFDVLFNEADAFRPDSDAVLRDIAAGMDNLYVASMRLSGGQTAPLSALPPAFGAQALAGARPDASATLLMPLVLEPESWRGGLINFEADADGTGRHIRLYHAIDGWRLPGLAASMARGSGADLPDRERVRLNWYGQSPRTLSYSDLLEDLGSGQPRLGPELRDSIILVGATASGLHDMRPTPLGQLTPGVHVLTTAIANLRAGDWLRDLPLRWPLLLALVLGLALAFHRRWSPVRCGLLLAVASLAALAGSQLALDQQLYAPVGAALGLAWLGFGLLTVEAQWLERREREATVGLFGRFLDPRVLDSLVRSGELDRDRKPEARD